MANCFIDKYMSNMKLYEQYEIQYTKTKLD